MSDRTTPASAPSVIWRSRALRRGAGTLGAAVALAAVGPAIANAAGADVANPVAVALRASGKTIATAFGTTGTETAPCTTPTADPTDAVATTSVPDPSATPVETVSVTPVETVSATPDEVVPAEPTATPTEVPATDDGDDCAETTETTPEPTESPSATPTEEETEAEAEENHGRIVSTVAKCAPRGKDPLLDVAGAPGNHGGYVKVAAHGGTLTLPWGTYDLSTQAGADELCASLDAARAELEPADDAKAAKGKDKAAKAKAAKPAKDKSAKAHGGKGGGKGRGGKR